MTVAKILFEGKEWIHVDTSASSVNIDGKTYYPFAKNPSGKYIINGLNGIGGLAGYIEIHFTISKDGKLTVTNAEGGEGDIPVGNLGIKKQPL